MIVGAAVNNDGANKVSFSAPSVDGQAEVVGLAHALAGIGAETIGYVEAHGTGTGRGSAPRPRVPNISICCGIR